MDSEARVLISKGSFDCPGNGCSVKRGLFSVGFSGVERGTTAACRNLVMITAGRVKYRDIQAMAYELHAVMLILQSLKRNLYLPFFRCISRSSSDISCGNGVECSLRGSIPSRKRFSWCLK